MPKGPKGEVRPANVIGAAVTVAKIATGEIEEGAEKDECGRNESHTHAERDSQIKDPKKAASR